MQYLVLVSDNTVGHDGDERLDDDDGELDDEVSHPDDPEERPRVHSNHVRASQVQTAEQALP